MCVPSSRALDEGAHLLRKDIQVDSLTNPQSIQVKIKASKTDPFRQSMSGGLMPSGSYLGLFGEEGE